MTTTNDRTLEREGHPRDGATGSWGAGQGFALVGAVFVLWQAWTLGAWLLEGPHQITAGRDPGSTPWWAARGYEFVAVLLAVAMGTYLVRACRRQKRLVLDAKLCIACLAGFWLDPSVNFLEPVFFYSTNWVNLNAWTGNQPGVVNPVAGEVPEPVLFLGLVYAFGLVGFAMVQTAIMRRVARRWPGISTPCLLGTAFVIAGLIDLAFEVPMFHLETWAYPGTAFRIGGPLGGVTLVGTAVAAMAITALASVRYFADPSGRSFLDRSLERARVRRRTGLSLLALVGFVSTFYFAAGVIVMAAGFDAPRFPLLPEHIIHDTCGAGTEYGTCPGSPGFRMPIK